MDLLLSCMTFLFTGAWVDLTENNGSQGSGTARATITATPLISQCYQRICEFFLLRQISKRSLFLKFFYFSILRFGFLWFVSKLEQSAHDDCGNVWRKIQIDSVLHVIQDQLWNLGYKLQA
jgi:hypothetical protein